MYNAGRYSGTGGVVQVDQVPYLVSILDTVSTEIIKNVNYELEAYIDNLVQSGLSRKIAIPLEYTTNRTASVTEASGGDGGESTTRVISCPSKYINFLNGKQ
ncbi:MAG: hypothetical protein H6767_06815 [Candidatus Peribacteria bacterium]|nr:MAG: hypothetical protein H6767_06815 [Candidatus Peribacteria bacterium]